MSTSAFIPRLQDIYDHYAFSEVLLLCVVLSVIFITVIAAGFW